MSSTVLPVSKGGKKGSKSKKNGVADDGDDDATAKASSKSNRKQQLVDHTYTDFSIISEEDDVKILEEESPQLPKPSSKKEAGVRERLKGMSCTYGPMRKNAGGVTQPFPGKLMEVLNRSDLAEIIEWMPHGRAFLVKQPKTFASQVLPRYFKQSKYLSFTRQLNLWEFKRITRGKDMGAYYHELFLRGRHNLAMRMKRQKIKGTGMKLTPNPGSEPDFYNDYAMMPKLQQVQGPLPPLPMERMGVLHQAGAMDVSSDENLLKALEVASSHREPQMPPTVLTHPQLQQIHQQHQQLVSAAAAAAGGGMMPGANQDYQRFFGAMNTVGGVNTIFPPETLHQIHQQQQLLQQQQQLQLQLHHAGPAANGLGRANGGYRHLYGAMHHQAGINPMLAAASQLPAMVPSSLLPSGMMPPSSNRFTSHAGSHIAKRDIAKRAYDDVLLAPGVRKQLGLSASGLSSRAISAGSMGGSFSADYGINNKFSGASAGSMGSGFGADYGINNKLSAVMLRLNNGGANPGQFNHAGSHIAKRDIAKRAYDDVLLAPGVRKQLGLSASGLSSRAISAGSMGGSFSADYGINNKFSGASAGSMGSGFGADYGINNKLSAVMLRLNNGGANPGQFNVPPMPAAAAVATPATIADAAATKKSKSTTPPPKKEAKEVFAGYGNDPLLDALTKAANDPLQDALQKVHKLVDDAASLQRAKAKILQSMAQSGVDPVDIDIDGEMKGESPDLEDEKKPKKRPSMGRPFSSV